MYRLYNYVHEKYYPLFLETSAAPQGLIQDYLCSQEGGYSSGVGGVVTCQKHNVICVGGVGHGLPSPEILEIHVCML